MLQNLLSGRRLLYAVLTLAVLAFVASQLLTTCDTKQTGELSRRQERRVMARRDSSLARATRYHARAERAAASAARAYDSLRVYNDSLTFLRRHETDVIHLAPADTARYQQLLSDIFGH